MNIQTIKPTSARKRSRQRECCDDKCPAGARNNYFLGKHLTPDSYRLEQGYGIERRRLTNRAIFGSGVVYGFALTIADTNSKLDPGELGIGEGYALDELGRELIQARGTALTLDNLVILDDAGKPVEVEGCDLDDRLKNLASNAEDCWLLSAHYAERTLGPVPLRDPCVCDRNEWDQICETVVYSLQRIDCDDCCTPWECGLHCCCAPDTPCCAERGRDRGPKEIERERQKLKEEFEKRLKEAGGNEERITELRAEYERKLKELESRHFGHGEEKRHARGGCACLCEHLADLEFDTDCVRLRDVGDCTRADLSNGVPLACLRLERDECGDWAIGAITDSCGPRRLVKRNDLLFDLINGCDLTRIDLTGWAHWHRSDQAVPFDQFLAALGGGEDYMIDEHSTRDFWVRFSRPVRIDTLGPEIFAMVVTSDQHDDFWRLEYRVPIMSIETDQVPAEEGDPAGYARSARIVVATSWLDQVTDPDNIFAKGDTRVEIKFFGDLVEDCLGATVDSNTRARSAYPSGNGVPGDTYLSTFTVSQHVVPVRAATRQSARTRRPTAAAS